MNGRTNTEAPHTTVDLVLAWFQPDKVNDVSAWLRNNLGVSEVESGTYARDILAGNPCTVFEELSELEAEENLDRLSVLGARVETRTWRHPDPCNVLLVHAGENKVRVVSVICKSLKGSLELAIRLVESAPVEIRTMIHRKQAERLRDDLRAAGAEALVTEGASSC